VIENDACIRLERRVKVVRELPWPLPALTVIQMSDADLDALDGAGDDVDLSWDRLNFIFRRIMDSPSSSSAGSGG
jgi:hypothetical protein